MGHPVVLNLSSNLPPKCLLNCTPAGVGFDFATGGYHDVAVIVSPELSRAECPQILDDVKVRS